MRSWRERLAALGYRFQFITLAGWHALNLSMFELASAYRTDGMLGYSQLQQREFASEADGYRATRHQAFVGTGYFDAVQTAITSGQSPTGAMQGSTEQAQFHVSRAVWTLSVSPAALAAELRQRFDDYNAEFARITRRAARHFLARDWHAARADAVQRIELYEQHVSGAMRSCCVKLGAAIARPRAVDRDQAAFRSCRSPRCRTAISTGHS